MPAACCWLGSGAATAAGAAPHTPLPPPCSRRRRTSCRSATSSSSSSSSCNWLSGSQPLAPSSSCSSSLLHSYSPPPPHHQRCREFSRSHAVSEHSSSSSIQQQDQHPLVERMYDHNWRSPLAGHDHPDASRRPVLALGKFDALHKGHQALAAAALQLGGAPVLLSFSGMAAVLGWAPRKPLVAPCDRPRVLHLWAQQLAQQQVEQQTRQRQRRARRQQRVAAAAASGSPQQQHPQQQLQRDAGEDSSDDDQPPPQLRVVPVRQRYIPFAAIRSLSPEAFVQHIADDFRAAGVVSGGNYRFGYRAAGDTDLLKQLCAEAGLSVAVVEMVGAATPGAVGPVSSTKIREMLDSCRMEAVKRSLGRPYRLTAELDLLDWRQQQQQQTGHSLSSSSSNGTDAPRPVLLQQAGWVFVPTHQLLNQHPAPGVFLCDVQLFVGATAHDDLLQLQQAVVQGDSSSSGGDASIHVLPVGAAACTTCIRAQQQQVEVLPEGLLVPEAIWEAAEGCLNNSAAARPVSSSGVTTSSSSSLSGTDPLMWDTDDRDDEDEGRGVGGGAGSSSSSAVQREGGQGPRVSALLVLDIESCLRQMCELHR